MPHHTKPKDDPYELLAHTNVRAPGYVDRLKEAHALDGLTPADATKVATQLLDLLYRFLVLGDGPTDPRLTEQLHNKSACAACLADGMGWDSPQRVSQAFSAAKAVLQPTPGEHLT
jgi:hypothetical protein